MLARILPALAAFLMTTNVAMGELVYLTPDATEIVGGLTVRDGDIAAYNTITDTATLFFDEDLFALDEEVNSFQVLSSDIVLLSTFNGSTLGGVSFVAGDVIHYNINTGIATEFFDGSLFAAGENVDAFHSLADGTMLISTVTTATLGGLTFEDGDVVRYNPTTDVATLFFDESLFSGNEDIDAVHLVGNNILRLSTELGATLGGLTFQDGDIVEYNMLTDTATLVMDETIFATNADINGYAVPEPKMSLIGLGALLASCWLRRLGGTSALRGGVPRNSP